MGSTLPTNWVEIEFGDIFSVMTNGGNFKQEDFQELGHVPVSRIETIWNEFIDETRVKYTKVSVNDFEKYRIRINDILFSHINSYKHLGKTDIYKEDIKLVHGINLLLLRTREEVNSDFTNYFIKYYRSKGGFLLIAQRSVNQSSINQKKLSSIGFPLPPLAEQERIVDKLDILFGQHKAMKKALDRIPQLIKDLRQQALRQAVTGKLTESWRKGKGLLEWKNLEIFELVADFKKDVRTGPFGSALSKSEYQTEGVPVWGIESIGLNGKFTGRNKVFITEEKARDLQSFSVKGGDIIISRSGTVGELCIIPKGVNNGYISTNLLKIVLNKEVVNSLFFCWMFKANPQLLYNLRNLCKGSTRLFITQNILKSLVYQIPPLSEQEEIVERVESLFGKVDLIEARYQTLKDKINAFPQAILHKAFKGELVGQLPTDGSAKDLLEEITALKKEIMGKSK
jgi:type I restriction enzyme S subunit